MKLSNLTAIIPLVSTFVLQTQANAASINGNFTFEDNNMETTTGMYTIDLNSNGEVQGGSITLPDFFVNPIPLDPELFSGDPMNPDMFGNQGEEVKVNLMDGSVSIENQVVGMNANMTPIPEPLTILGSATALGVGALLKREHSKKKSKS